jgi:hypothetical protein
MKSGSEIEEYQRFGKGSGVETYFRHLKGKVHWTSRQHVNVGIHLPDYTGWRNPDDNDTHI